MSTFSERYDGKNIVSTQIKAENIVLNTKKDVFEAIFSDKEGFAEHIETIIQTLVKNFSIPNENGYKRFFITILVELLENIQKHCDVSEYHKAKFTFKKQKDHYSIEVSSFSEKDDFGKLNQATQELNNMSLDELGVIYKNKMNNGKISDRGGAGLGMITIARSIKKRQDDFKNIFSIETGGINGHIETKLRVNFPITSEVSNKQREAKKVANITSDDHND